MTCARPHHHQRVHAIASTICF